MYMMQQMRFLSSVVVLVRAGVVHTSPCPLRRAGRLRQRRSRHAARVLRARRRRAPAAAAVLARHAAGPPSRTDRVRRQCRVPARLQLRQPVAVHVPAARPAVRLQLAAGQGCSVSRPPASRHDRRRRPQCPPEEGTDGTSVVEMKRNDDPLCRPHSHCILKTKTAQLHVGL